MQNSVIYYILLSMDRKTFKIQGILINGRLIDTVIVDEHAVDNHPDVTDDMILDLVRKLDGIEQVPDDSKGAFELCNSPIY